MSSLPLWERVRVRGLHPHLYPLPSRERGKERLSRQGRGGKERLSRQGRGGKEETPPPSGKGSLPLRERDRVRASVTNLLDEYKGLT